MSAIDNLAQFLHVSYCSSGCKSWAKDRQNATRILRTISKAPSDTAVAYQAGLAKGRAEGTTTKEAQRRVEQMEADLEIARHEAAHHRAEREAIEESYAYASRLAAAYEKRNHYLETRKPRSDSVVRPGRIANNTTNEG